MSDQVLTEADKTDLHQKFQTADAEIGAELHRRMEARAEKLQTDAAALVTE